MSAAPIINEQYASDETHRGECVISAKGFLDAIMPTLTTEEDKQATVAATVDAFV